MSLECWQSTASTNLEGSEFQVVAAATEIACRVRSVRVLDTDSSWVRDDQSGLTGTMLQGDCHEFN